MATNGALSISYDELLKDTARYNSTLLKSRKLHLPFLDNSTGIAQRPCQLYKSVSDRIEPLEGYIYSYKPLRWKKLKNNYPVLVKSITLGGFGYSGNVLTPGNAGNGGNFDAPDSLATFDEEFNNSNTTVNDLSQFAVEDSEEETEVVEVTRRRGGGRRGRGGNGTRASNTRGSGIGPRRRSSNVVSANVTPAASTHEDESCSSAKVSRNGTTLTPPLLTNATLIPPVGFRSQPPKLESSHTSTHHQDESSATSSAHSPAAASLLHSNSVSKVPSLPSSNSVAKSPVAAALPPKLESVVTNPIKSNEEPKKTPQISSSSTSNTKTPTFCDFNCSFRRVATPEGTIPMATNSQSGKDQAVRCRDCDKMAHPICLSFNENMRVSVTRYKWQCLECKTCWMCGTAENDDEMLFCDDCDRGYHMYCLKPPLSQAPDGNWSCDLCLDTFKDKAASSANKGTTNTSSSTIRTAAASGSHMKKEKH